MQMPPNTSRALVRFTVAAVQPRALRSIFTAGGCGSDCGR
jgi:bacterioferritin-associated ferredoxin